jgi:hypothetical protein
LLGNVGVAATDYGCTAFGDAFMERASEAARTRYCRPSVSPKRMRQGTGAYASASEVSSIAPANTTGLEAY